LNVCLTARRRLSFRAAIFVQAGGRVDSPSGRPKALDPSKTALARRMHASGESANTIASTLGVSRATVYRVLVKSSDE
jgi:DNA invertase Pin-like site-specific DNA recombinase